MARCPSILGEFEMRVSRDVVSVRRFLIGSMTSIRTHLPGFQSGDPRRMLVAAIVYIGAAVGGIVTAAHADWPATAAWLTAAFVVGIVADARALSGRRPWQYLPGLRSGSSWRALGACAFYSVAGFTIWAFAREGMVFAALAVAFIVASVVLTLSSRRISRTSYGQYVPGFRSG